MHGSLLVDLLVELDLVADAELLVLQYLQPTHNKSIHGYMMIYVHTQTNTYMECVRGEGNALSRNA